MPINLGEMNSIARDKIISPIIDNFFDTNSFLKYMKQQGRINTFEGGKTLIVPIEYDDNRNVQNFSSGNEEFDLGVTPVVDSIQRNWVGKMVPVSINKVEKWKSGGVEGLFNLLKIRTENAMKTFENKLEGDILGDYSYGASYASNSLDGVGKDVLGSTSGITYAGISPATFTKWDCQYGSTTISLAALGMMVAKCTWNGESPDLALVAKSTWPLIVSKYQALMGSVAKPQDANPYTQEYLQFGTTKLSWVQDTDGAGMGITTSVMLFLNTNHLTLFVHKETYGENGNKLYSWSGMREADTQIIEFGKMLFFGQFVCNSRRHQGLFKILT